MRIADVMTQPLRCVPGSATVDECATLLAMHRVRHLPVVDAAGACTGLLTDYELRRRAMLLDEGAPGAVARQLQRDVQVFVGPDELVVDALRRLRRATQDAVLVGGPDRIPVGILTEYDVMRLAARSLTADEPLDQVEPLPLVEASMPALEARSWMARERLLHALCVRDGRLVGVLSFRDVALEDDIEEHLCASDVASRPMATSKRLSGGAVAAILHRRKVGCLPVVDGGWRPIGLTTRRHVIAALAEQLDAAR